MKPISPEPWKSDASAQWLAKNYGMPVRRNYRAASVAVPSGTLILVDPTGNHGVEVPGILEPAVAVDPKVWTLEDGSTLVGSIFVNCVPLEPNLTYGRKKIRNLGRVEVNSGVLAILDRDLWSQRPEALRGELLRQRIERQEFGEVVLDAATQANAVLLPTGYGPGRYAIVARFADTRVIDLEVYLLKGNTP